MTELAFIDVIGFWIGIFLTFCIFSFLYKDNPFYKFAEHVFIGVSIGYVITQQYYSVLQPKLIDPLVQGVSEGQLWVVLRCGIAVVLVLCMFAKLLSPRWSWLGRYPLAFVVALYAGIQINAVAQSDLGSQVRIATKSIDNKRVNINRASAEEIATLPGMTPALVEKILHRRQMQSFGYLLQVTELTDLTAQEEQVLQEQWSRMFGLDGFSQRASVDSGERFWFGIFSDLVLLIGLLAALVYFYFSVPHTGVVGKISRFGVWILMIGFGASFGFTVQGRIALAIGRAHDVLGRNLSEIHQQQVMAPWFSLGCIGLLGVCLFFWELSERKTTKS